MDNFHEEVIIKRDRTLLDILFSLALVMMIFLAVLAFMGLQAIIAGNFDVVLIAYTLLTGAGAVFLYMRRDRLRTEYDYTFTNGILDFAQVFNSAKRKPLGTMNVKNVEACGYVSSGSFHRYATMPDVKRMNWFLNRDSELFYFFFVKDGVKKMIVIEPGEKMVALIKQYVARNAFQVS